MEVIKRIHHITAIVGDPNENLRFYRDVLGLRLIKQTVNFDDSGVYHLYFGDYHGNPGTIITFFPWTNDNYGRKGSGQVGKIAFRVPKNSLDHWQEHLNNQNIEVHKTKLFGKDTLEFEDIHGLELAIVEGATTADCTVILSFHGDTLWSGYTDTSETLITDLIRLEKVNRDDDYLNFQTVGEEIHHLMIALSAHSRGRFGIETAHHSAWSVSELDKIKKWHTTLQVER